MALKKPDTAWMPLQSDPNMMNNYLKNLGVPANFGMSDVVSMEVEHVDAIPGSPPLALMLLFPLSRKYSEYLDEQEKIIKQQKEQLEGVYFIKQTIENICGTIAIIHIVANNENVLNLKPDSVLKKFLDSTRDLSPEEKAIYLEKDKAMYDALKSTVIAEGAQSSSEESDHHFIAFVHVNGMLLELDGRKSGPVIHGNTCKKTFMKDAANVCKQYMERDPDNINFTVLSFGSM